MATKLTLDSHSNILECAVCLHPYKSPKLLPCFHTFCESCLTTLVHSPGGAIGTLTSFPCPLCRADTPVPPGGVSAYQHNFYIAGELESTRLGEASATCDVCCKDKNPVFNKCVECDKFLCNECLPVHNMLLKTHTLIHVTKGGPVKIIREAFCPKHTEEKLRFYCHKCRISICRDCRMTSHAEGHTSVDLSDLTEKAKQLVLGVTEIVSKEMLPAVKSELELSARALHQKREAAKSLRKEFEGRAKVLATTIQAALVESLKSLDDAVRIYENDSRNHDNHFSRLKSQHDHCKLVLEGGCEADVLAAADNLRATFGSKHSGLLDECSVALPQQDFLWDRSDEVYLSKVKGESGHFTLKDWKQFALGYIGKVRLRKTETPLSFSQSSFETEMKTCVQKIQTVMLMKQ